VYVVIRKVKGMRSVDEAARRAVAGIGPILKESPGFKGYYVFADESGGGGSVTLFESRAAAEAANAKAVAWIKENLADFSDGQPPEVTIGKVVGTVTG
jgi:hypothetical protein